MVSKMSASEQNIMNIRMKLYSVQHTFGFESEEAGYVTIIAGECINELRRSNSVAVFDHCSRKMEQALENIEIKENRP